MINLHATQYYVFHILIFAVVATLCESTSIQYFRENYDLQTEISNKTMTVNQKQTNCDTLEGCEDKSLDCCCVYFTAENVECDCLNYQQAAELAYCFAGYMFCKIWTVETLLDSLGETKCG